MRRTIALAITLLLGTPAVTFAQNPFSEAEMAAAVAVQAAQEEFLLSTPGVRGVGIGERDGELVLLVLTHEAEMEKGVAGLQASFAGAASGLAIVWHEVGEVVAEQMNLGTSTGNSILCVGPSEPPVGNTGNFCDVGTAGYKVCDNNDPTVGGWITNNHVASSGCPGKCPNNAPIGTNLFSPSLVDNTPVCSAAGLTNVGTLNRFVPLVLDGATNNLVDAAFVQGTDAQVSNNIQNLGAQGNMVAAPFLTQPVCKNGRTTGLTCGIVSGVNVTINVGYNQTGNPSAGGCGLGSGGRFVNAVMYSPTPPSTDMSQGGDSGAAVVDGANNAVALHYAGGGADGFGNPMGAVLAQLQVSLCADIPDPPTADANGPYAAECSGATTSVGLDGTGSDDPDPGDSISFAWTTDCPGGSFDDATSSTPVLTLDTSAVCSLSCGVDLTVTDSTGQTDSDASTVTIADTLPPDLVCPPDVTIECDESTAPSNTGAASGSDVCDPSIAISFSDATAPGACAQESSIERTWSAIDDCGNESLCAQTITVVDTKAPVAECNAPGTILPLDAPISFTATAVDSCDDDPTVEITGFDCFEFTKKGKRIDKTGSCEVSASGDTLTIHDSGGVGDNITWTVDATDGCGNASQLECSLTVVNPGQN